MKTFIVTRRGSDVADEGVVVLHVDEDNEEPVRELGRGELYQGLQSSDRIRAQVANEEIAKAICTELELEDGRVGSVADVFVTRLNPSGGVLQERTIRRFFEMNPEG